MLSYQAWKEKLSVRNGVRNTKPYNFFTESVLDTIRLGDLMVMSEAADFQEFYTESSSMLAEAYMNNNPRFGVLHEAVFSSIKERVVKFFEKAKSIALGIINRIKEFMLKFTNKTAQWADTIEPRIKAADRSGAFSAETYNWNTKYIATGISAGIMDMHNGWKSKVQSKIRDGKALTALKSAAAAQARNSQTTVDTTLARGDDGSYKQTRTVSTISGIESLARETESVEAELRDVIEHAPQIAGNAYKVRGNTADDIWNGIVLMARGGDQQKAMRQIGASAAAMLEAVRQSGTWLGNIQKVYEDHVSALEQYRRSLETEGNQIESANASNGESSDVSHVVTAYVKAKYEYCIRVTQVYESYMAKGNSLNIQLVQDMTRDYMNILTAYANKKGK